MEIAHYEKEWSSFQDYVKDKARKRCTLTGKNWLKLREWHLEQFLKNHENPFGFLFYVKYFHPCKYRSIHCMPKLYGEYKSLRRSQFCEMIEQVNDLDQ